MIEWRVKELVANRGWTVIRLARESGLDEKTVRGIVTGRSKRVDLSTIERLCAALSVTPGALWRTDQGDAWAAFAGVAGRAGPEEIEAALAGWPDEPNPSLERATRPT